MESERVTTDYDAWVLINTIRLHFKNKRSIDGMLYTSFPVSKFSKAGERFLCQRMVKNYRTEKNIALYVASNLVYNPDIWFHDLESDECRKRYFAARKVLDAPLYSIGELLRKSSMQELTKGSPLPRFISELMSGEITPEQICILDIAKPFVADVCKEKPNLVVDAITGRLVKYRKFCSISDVETRDKINQLISHNSTREQ